MRTTTIILEPGAIVQVELQGVTTFTLNADDREFWLSMVDGPWALASCAGFRSEDCPVAIRGEGTAYLKARPGYDETVGVSLVTAEV